MQPPDPPAVPSPELPTVAGKLLLAVEATPAALAPRLAEAWAGGPAVLPLDPQLPPRVRGALVAQLKPGAIVKPGGLVELPGATPVASDTVAVVPTSGSTGMPKGVVLSRAALEASVTLGLERTGSDPAVPWLCCLPVTHVGGILVLLRALVTGTPAVAVDRFDAAEIAALSGPLHLAVVPTMLHRLLDAGADPSAWRTVLVGGARMPADLRTAITEAGAAVTTTYGMTETSGGCVYDGVPLEGVSVAAGSDGRLRIGGPTLMDGYRLAVPPDPSMGGTRLREGPDAGSGTGVGRGPTMDTGVDADGWYTTSDIGEVSADGRVRVLGRADDVIVTGGEKIVAAEVAARLEEHPAVAEAEVIGVPDPEWGQRAVAVVVPAEVGAILSLALLRSFVTDAMPRYAAPQDLMVVNTLPRLSNGKVDRIALARAVA